MRTALPICAVAADSASSSVFAAIIIHRDGYTSSQLSKIFARQVRIFLAPCAVCLATSFVPSLNAMSGALPPWFSTKCRDPACAGFSRASQRQIEVKTNDALSLFD